MTQNTVLAAGNTAATSTDIVVAAGSSVKVGIFSSVSNDCPAAAKFTVFEDTPGSLDNVVALLSNTEKSVVLNGPGTYRVKRRVYTGPAFGVFTET